MHYCAKTGSTELLAMLLEEGSDPTKTNSRGETALHIACRHCNLGIVKGIIEFLRSEQFRGKSHGNVMNLANDEGETAFHLSAELGISQSHIPFEDVDITRLLFENGANPFLTTYLTKELPLHYCARSGNPDMIEEIAFHFRSSFQLLCNRQDKMGWSPLMTACNEGHAGATEILLKNIARADVFDEVGKTALHLAAENGHAKCCEILLQHKVFVNAKTKIGVTPLHLAAQNGFANVVEILVVKYSATVNALSVDKKTPLHLAAAAGRTGVCLLLLRLGADPNAVDAVSESLTGFHSGTTLNIPFFSSMDKRHCIWLPNVITPM